MPKEFADQMENRGKDDIWELSVLATCGWIRRIYPVFLEFIEKKKIIIIIFNEGAQLATAVFSGALINWLIQLITLIETVFWN